MESITDCFGLPFRNKRMQPCWQITFPSKSSWLFQAIYSHVGSEWNLRLHYALVQLLSLRRSKTASRLMLATQGKFDPLFLSSGVRSGTVIVSETQTELCLPFVDPHQRNLTEFSVICFVDTGKEASTVSEGLPRKTYEGSWLRKIKIRQQRLRTQVAEQWRRGADYDRFLK